MTRSLMIGGLDLTSLALREAAALPLLDDVAPVQAWFTDCLKQVIAERRGVILMAPHGCGKSIAVERDVEEFSASEEAKRLKGDHAYAPRRVVPVTTLRVETARELFIALYRAAFDTLPQERIYRRNKTSDELRDELIARCAEETVVAFVVDEAQTLTDGVLEALRDLMAVSETACKARIEKRAADSVLRPGGLGVLLVATLAFQPRLATLSEFGRRWLRTETVGALEEATVPDILKRMLPAFADGARQLGTEAWVGMIAQSLTLGRQLPISTLSDVTRTYIRRASALQPKARTLKDLKWDLDLFHQAVYELVGLQLYGEEAA